MQYVPPRGRLARAYFKHARPRPRHTSIGGIVSQWLQPVFDRDGAGDFAVRGGIIDLFPPGSPDPMRLTCSARRLSQFAVSTETQRSKEQCDQIFLFPASEIHLNDEAVSRFRRGYTATFGAVTEQDPLYEATARARLSGYGTPLPLLYDKLDLPDHFGECLYFTDPQTGNAYQERSEQISDYYTAREEAMHDKSGQGGTIKPLPPEQLYLSDEVRQRSTASHG